MSGQGPLAIEAAGEQALVVRFGTQIDPATNDRVLATWRALGDGRPTGVQDVVPGYASLLVLFDPDVIPADAVRGWLQQRLARPAPATNVAPRLVTIPVLYDVAVAPDLAAVAADKQMTIQQLVALHSAPLYRCYLVGFRPGFPFLGKLDPRLVTPRLATPRLRVPAGAVGIGGAQTGIYPVESPGGWRLIGRTPVMLFDAGRSPPALVAPGDQVRFVPIDADEFARLSA